MPSQIITLEVEYSVYDEDGNERSAPIDWPWEQMADHYSDCEGYDTETHRVKAYAPSRITPIESDAAEIQSWHEECETNCGDEHCSAPDSEDEDED